MKRKVQNVVTKGESLLYRASYHTTFWTPCSGGCILATKYLAMDAHVQVGERLDVILKRNYGSSTPMQPVKYQISTSKSITANERTELPETAIPTSIHTVKKR